MNHETTAPVQSLVDEILAELDQSAAFHRELNTSNYDHDDVCRLNDWGVDACTALEKAAGLIRQQQQELTAIEAMARMLADGEWAEHVGQLGGPIAQRLETEITRMHNEQQALIAQQAAPAAVPDWSAVHKFVEQYVKEYELDDGEGASHTPTEFESLLIIDAAIGLIDSDEFRALLSAAPPPPAGTWESPCIQPAQQPAGYFVRRSGFGPHVEVEPTEAGAIPLYAAPPAQQIDQLRHERDALAGAIGNAAVKVGIIAPNTRLAGPMLLMLCDDLAECCQSAEAERDSAKRNASAFEDAMGEAQLEVGRLRALMLAAQQAAYTERNAPAEPEQDAVAVPRELLECYLNGGGGDWVEAGHKLRDLLGGGA
ncbi:hypothetical protein [Azotobacter chroococcum]|uniref:Uncharacterized protein n=1 Tax=Azotobacter chroococcum TaxID=353 RepID=A0AAP9YH70_9GAMM|nr:hypothetical protein [Azotobacter chroococcum]QQE90430.1 hypothetical protein GKQ51_09230 [Azotobacter chroococcum]